MVVCLCPCAPAAVVPHLDVMAKVTSVGGTPDTEGKTDQSLSTACSQLSIESRPLYIEGPMCEKGKILL